MKKWISFLVLLLLSACGISVSPESAAVKMFPLTTASMQVDQDTLELRQTIEAEDGSAIVMLSFQGVLPEMGPVTCLYTYQIFHSLIGWRAANGGGACQQDQPKFQEQDLDVQIGYLIGQPPLDAGYGHVYGYVHNTDIVKVQIIWDDDDVTEVDVVNGTYLAIRNTQLAVKSVVGLSEQGQEIYTYFPIGSSVRQP